MAASSNAAHAVGMGNPVIERRPEFECGHAKYNRARLHVVIVTHPLMESG
jgi:hypothetical protein